VRRRTSRAAVTAGALALATTATTTQPAGADVDVAKKRLQARAGQRVAVIGAVQPGAAGLRASLQVRRSRGWHTIDRDRTVASGRYVLRARVRRPMSAPARVLVRRPASAAVSAPAPAPAGRSGHRERQPLGRLNVYRWANASWYGPGLYGNPLGCGGTLSAGKLGVAHRSLPCGSRLTLRHRGRTVRVRVIDRGPYVGGREYDLTAATAQRLRFSGHGAILSTR
jgi:peptidoglycan lytic transglycosylase